MAKESFLLYHGYYEPIKNLSLEDKGMLFDAIFQFSISGIEPNNTSRIYMAFQFFKNQMVQDAKKYDRIVDRNRENGLKGGRPNPNNPVGLKKPKKADTDTVTVTDTVTETETDFLNWQSWGNLIVEQSDPTWEAMRGRIVTRSEMDSFISVATRNKWVMRTAQEFRTSLKGFSPFGQTQKINRGKLQ